MKPANDGVSFVLGSFDRADLIKKTISSIRGQISEAEKSCEIIVVDGGSTDGTLEWLVKQKDIVTIVQHNRGEWNGRPVARRSWGYFMNLAFRCAGGKRICMLSDDCLLVPGSIEKAVALADSYAEKGRRLGGVAFYYRDWPKDERYFVNKAFGRTMVNHGLYDAAALRAVGYANEQDYMFYYADADLSLRLWEKGYPIVACPEAIVEHYYHGDETNRRTNNPFIDQDKKAFKKQWSGRFPMHRLREKIARKTGWNELLVQARDEIACQDESRTVERFRDVMKTDA